MSKRNIRPKRSGRAAVIVSVVLFLALFVWLAVSLMQPRVFTRPQLSSSQTASR